MNRKQFSILIALLVAVGTAGLIVHQRGRNSWQAAGQAIGQKLLPGLPVNDISQIIIRSGTNELNLTRRDNRWRVKERGDYPANFSGISGLLVKLADLKVVQTEEVGASQLGRFELLPPGAGANTGASLELRDAAGKTLGSLLLGRKHMRQVPAGSTYGGESWPDGRYVRVGDLKTIALISDTLDSIRPDGAEWLNKDFIHAEKLRSIAVQFAAVSNSWKLTRASETNDWQLAEAKPDEILDPGKITGVTSTFTSPGFIDVTPGDFVGTNQTVVTIETFVGFHYSIRIGENAGDNYQVSLSVEAQLPTERKAGPEEKAEDKVRLDQEFKDQLTKLNEKLARERAFAGWTYQIPAYNVDPVLKHRSALQADSKANEAEKSAN